MMPARLLKLEVNVLRLPFRGRFSHAAAERDETDTVVVGAYLSDGTVGYGEGLPREYVTGETSGTVVEDIRSSLAGQMKGVEPKSFSELLEIADNLPFVNSAGRVMNAARCSVELALLDAYSRSFGVDLSVIGGWLGFSRLSGGQGSEGCRVSGVLDCRPMGQLKRRYLMMRCYGLRDFKLKLGTAEDEQVIAGLKRYLGDSIRRGKITLRVDANGGWDIDEALAIGEELHEMGVVCLEQPLAASDKGHWRMLADLGHVPLMADESLVSMADARYLIENDLADYFNIRISKNGGLIPSIRMAEEASKAGRRYQLGAMVGETSVLAAAGRWFLRMVPEVRFVEIGYGRFLLQEDIVRRDVRFGYGGRVGRASGPGLGVEVMPERIQKFLAGSATQIEIL